MTFWINGEWRDAPEAIRIDDRGFLLGDGVFETLLLRDGVPAFLDEHLSRLSLALQATDIKAVLPDNPAALMGDLARRNGIGAGDASLRLTVTRGPGARGLKAPGGKETEATTLMTIAKASAPVEKMKRLVVSMHCRNAEGVCSRHKTLSYLANILARSDADKVGCDDALMLNEAGRIVCASAANIFVVTKTGAILTPRIEDGALPGVVRGILLRSEKIIGAPISEQPISMDDLDGADIFLTNSLMGVALARLADMPSRTPGEIFKKAQSCYAQALANDLKRRAGAQ